MALYRCSKCSKHHKRVSTKEWIRSYCSVSNSFSRLILIKPVRNLKLWNHWIAELRDLMHKAKIHYPDGTRLSMSKIKLNFGEGLRESFNEGLTPKEAFENETDYMHE